MLTHPFLFPRSKQWCQHYWLKKLNGKMLLSGEMGWNDLFHMTQILSPADTRINFISTKQNGNCHVARAKDKLRNLLSLNQKPRERKPCFLQLVNWLFQNSARKQTYRHDTCHYSVNTTRRWPQQSLQPSWSLRAHSAFNVYCVSALWHFTSHHTATGFLQAWAAKTFKEKKRVWCGSHFQWLF